MKRARTAAGKDLPGRLPPVPRTEADVLGALQLAAALEVAGETPTELGCLDRRLGDAASRENLTVIDEI